MSGWRFLFSSVFLLLAFLNFPASAQSPQDLVKVKLLSEYEQVSPNTERLLLGIEFEVEPEWHIYWQNPGDSGTPPEVEWTELKGVAFSPFRWPVPVSFPVGPLVNFGYGERVVFPLEVELADLDSSSSSLPIDAEVRYLVCKEDCIPGKSLLNLNLPIGDGARVSVHQERLSRSFSDSIDLSASPQFQLQARFDGVSGVIQAGSELPEELLEGSFLFPLEEGAFELSHLTEYQSEVGGWPVKFSPDSVLKSFVGLLRVQDDAGARGLLVEVFPATSSGSEAAGEASKVSDEDVSVLSLLIYAFIGGLILNAMPCVFPIIGIKVLSFVNQAKGDRLTLLIHGLAFAAGVVVSMWGLVGLLLLLKAAGSEVGWGFQLQYPPFIVFLIFLFTGLAANLYGLVEIGGSLQTKAGSVETGDHLWGSFLSGGLATLIATPCTAPFMATAVGVALGLSNWVIFTVFTSLGLGMAAPYVLLTVSPKLVEFMPRPGLWMDTLKRLLAFPLLASVVWLVWVLGYQVGINGVALVLGGLVVLGLGIFLVDLGAKGRVIWRNFGIVLSFSALAGAVYLVGNVEQSEGSTSTAHLQESWEKFSPEYRDELIKEGRPVFVDFTASWCLTCQLNKLTVLHTGEIQRAFKEHGVVLLKADWTNSDPVITQELKKFDRQGVPVNVLYCPGEEQPVLFPSVLTKGKVLSELDKLGEGGAALSLTK